jgi:hypothetical protein
MNMAEAANMYKHVFVAILSLTHLEVPQRWQYTMCSTGSSDAKEVRWEEGAHSPSLALNSTMQSIDCTLMSIYNTYDVHLTKENFSPSRPRIWCSELAEGGSEHGIQHVIGGTCCQCPFDNLGSVGICERMRTGRL